MKSASNIDPLVLAQKCFALIDKTKKSGTYKYATLLALLNVISTKLDQNGTPTPKIMISDIGREVMRLYWNQAVPYKGADPLKQSPQQDIVYKIVQYRTTHDLKIPRATMDQARCEDPTGFRTLEKRSIKTVANMPIRLLQKFGEGNQAREELFLFDFSWTGDLKEKQIDTAHLILKPGVGEGLLLLSPLLRAQIENQWMQYVSDQNNLDASALNNYLFGFTRSAVATFAKYLIPLQEGKCFYCGAKITNQSAHVDHVIPWSFSHDDGLDNLVATCSPCNLSKSALLLGLEHLKNWSKRLVVGSPENLAITDLAEKQELFRDLNLTHRHARSAYRLAPEGTSVWNSRDIIDTIDQSASLGILAGPEVVAADWDPTSPNTPPSAAVSTTHH